MFDVKFIEEYLPTIEGLATKYQNEYHDYDELFSEGQLVLLEYLIKNKDDSRENLKGRLWSVINHRLRKLSEETNNAENIVDLTKISYSNIILDVGSLYEAISSLKEREQEVISKYYGLNTNKQTLEEIGEFYGITKCRVKNIRKYAEYKIKQYLHNKGINNYSDCEEMR